MSTNERADQLGILDKWERIAYLLDVYRVMPRMALVGWGFMLYEVGLWFMGLKAPDPAQSAFIVAVYGATPFILNFYMQQGIDWEERINGKFIRAKEGIPDVQRSDSTV
jgi:hypothetical protein